MENGDIPNEDIQASDWYSSRPASNARLNGPSKRGAYDSAENPWIQADLGYQTFVSGVLTQGDGDGQTNGDWVTSFKVSTFLVNANS